MMLLIDNYDSFTHNLYQSVARFVDVHISRNDQISLEQIESLNPLGIILSPGPGKAEDAGICLEIIKYFKDKIPILGVCLGHQAIGISFGANVERCSKILHGKSSEVNFENKGIFKGIKKPFFVGRYHSLCIQKESIPKDLQIDAVSDTGVIMGISHKIYPCFGVQFHPESFLTKQGEVIIENFVKICNSMLISTTCKNM